MLSRKIGRSWKNGLTGSSKLKEGFYILLTSVLLGITGCSSESGAVSDTLADESEAQNLEKNIPIEKNIAEIFCDIYREAITANPPGSLEAMRVIIERLGESGYAAVDRENQIDMTEADKVTRFCEKVDAAEDAQLTVIVVSHLGGFTKYGFKTECGIVDIVREYYQYSDGRVEHRNTGTYRADSWQYTEEGYLLFEGHWFSEQYSMLVASDASEHVGLRVKSLDEKCRELNRQYVFPIGYGGNNMFLVDWSEDDFAELNFYDLFDIFYPFVHGQYIPYTADDNLGVGAVYRIPKEEFEAVIMTYLKIGSETLQSKTIYFPEDETYEYKPRGFYETEYPGAIPFPEVVNYVENSDGTVKLTVNLVLPYENTSKAYAHEVVIRPLNDGGVQYVSNHIIPSNDHYEQTWHVPRFTEEEWERVYGNIE